MSMVEFDERSFPSEYQLDNKKVMRAFIKMGLKTFFETKLSEAQIAYATENGLTEFQCKLHYLFKQMLAEELRQCKEEFECGLYDKPVLYAGLTLSERMLQNPEIAENVFGDWAMRLGVNHLYADTLGMEKHQLHGVIFKDSSGRNVYERYLSVLKVLYPYN